MVDYIVVGLGLAGLSFCEVLEKHGKSFMVIDDDSQKASEVAGGMYNPVILKRFTLAWNAKEQLDLAMPFYSALEQKLQLPLDYKIQVLRRLVSVEEQNLWYEATDKPQLDYFLSPKLVPNANTAIAADHDYGEVRFTGRIDTKILLRKYKEHLQERNVLRKASFNFEALQFKENHISYQGISAGKIVFATGYGLKKNPYFNYLPLNGTKGELLTIKAPKLQEDRIIKSSVFLIPLGNDLYRVGATYKWKDKTNTPTKESRTELLQKLESFLNCEYEVIDHVAGIRPTTADRRPLVGQHPEHKALYILNGLGSRGVIIAPYASRQLYHHIEHGTDLDAEMDIARCTKKYYHL
ncbi:NAD(P)/FAD-dependent oxidoreductase [Spongiimicrobium salis]|uniref:NAD(P)/FAD-dependent oxidoreductase n=1 Tax=Spongiimicrobium salis TaxID=1667022 RepID=UPI00374D9773